MLTENVVLIEQYHKERNNGKSPLTIKTETFSLSRLEGYVKKPLKEVTKQELVNYFDWLVKHENLGAYTIVTHKILVKKFYKWLYGWQRGDRIPEIVNWIELNKKRAYKLKTKADLLTEDEIKKMIQVLRKPIEQAMLAVHANLATRPGRELCDLTIGSVVKEKDGYCICVDGKTGQRPIPLTWSTPYLLTYLNVHPDRNNRNAPLWINQRRQKYEPQGFRMVVKKAAKLAGITKRVTPHLFRHTKLTELTRKQLPEAYMRKFAGWETNSAMPSVYCHIDNDDVKQFIREIEPTLTVEQQVENQVAQRLQEEKQNMENEILTQLIETLKNPQHKMIQDMLFAQSEQP